METCHFKMHPEMSRAIIAIARVRDVTVGQILRDLVAEEIRRHHDARPSARMDEPPRRNEKTRARTPGSVLQG